MSDADSVIQTFNNIREWNEFGERLNAILKEVKDKSATFRYTLRKMESSSYILMSLSN